ncbi:hypothetical protein [Pseudoalteromonas viridis]|uniref:Uncharacterized protein n=1 Tax=Pseudoalteromonas viridis TaxID=339617 RepID=A0ABX7V6E5_9GAMM|nr:hypothetical protein [Pseudoalteromonas viridis]QTL35002.1 hypothetical protein J5X90_15960 [Pseudoalteromonas viridis]
MAWAPSSQSIAKHFSPASKALCFQDDLVERFKLIDTGFSTADAEYPEIIQADGDVILKFKDWREQEIEVFFADPVAVKWQMAEVLSPEERFDSCYEVVDSNWLQLHLEKEVVSASEGYKHYKFNFNELGTFEVLAIAYTLKT